MDLLMTLDTLMLEAGGCDAPPPDLVEAAAKLSAALLEAVLAEHAGLRQLDSYLYPDPDYKAARRIAQSLHAAWRRWSDDTALLLDRVSRVNGLGGHIDRVDELINAHGRAMAMIQMTAERVDRAREQVKRGEVFSLEEVRRELRAGAHR